MIRIILLLLTAIIITQCGFKVVKYNDLLNFEINQINSSGDKRINYKIKNKLSLYNKTNQQKIINLNIKTEKNKFIKEKNIKNEVTKYNVKISTVIEILNVNGVKIKEFAITEIGEYSVHNQYSKTLNNEKKLTALLTKKILDQITLNLLNFSNDF